MGKESSQEKNCNVEEVANLRKGNLIACTPKQITLNLIEHDKGALLKCFTFIVSYLVAVFTARRFSEIPIIRFPHAVQ